MKHVFASTHKLKNAHRATLVTNSMEVRARKSTNVHPTRAKTEAIALRVSIGSIVPVLQGTLVPPVKRQVRVLRLQTLKRTAPTACFTASMAGRLEAPQEHARARLAILGGLVPAATSAPTVMMETPAKRSTSVHPTRACTEYVQTW